MADFARYKYKCRKCNEVFVAAKGCWSNMSMQMAHAIIGDGTVGLLTTHSCGDGAMGIADLIGVDQECR